MNVDDKERFLLVSTSVLINNPKAKLVKFLHSITCYYFYLRYYLRRSYRPLQITGEVKIPRFRLRYVWKPMQQAHFNSHKEVKFSHINSVFSTYQLSLSKYRLRFFGEYRPSRNALPLIEYKHFILLYCIIVETDFVRTNSSWRDWKICPWICQTMYPGRYGTLFG